MPQSADDGSRTLGSTQVNWQIEFHLAPITIGQKSMHNTHE
jgi:hypothetical protein